MTCRLLACAALVLWCAAAASPPNPTADERLDALLHRWQAADSPARPPLSPLEV